MIRALSVVVLASLVGCSQGLSSGVPAPHLEHLDQRSLDELRQLQGECARFQTPDTAQQAPISPQDCLEISRRVSGWVTPRQPSIATYLPALH